MKKINRVFTTITVSIVTLVIMGIIGTYLSDYLKSINWFGDYMIEKPTGFFQSNVMWGARHYWYNWGVFFLFLTSVIKVIVRVHIIINEE